MSFLIHVIQFFSHESVPTLVIQRYGIRQRSEAAQLIWGVHSGHHGQEDGDGEEYDEDDGTECRMIRF